MCVCVCVCVKKQQQLFLVICWKEMPFQIHSLTRLIAQTFQISFHQTIILTL